MASKIQEPSILLLVDIQHGIVEPRPEDGPRSTPSFAQNVTHLLRTWRSKSWPIIHVHNDDIKDPDSPLSSKHPITFAPHACATPAPGEPIFVKHVGSPFVETDILAAIEELGKRMIVVVGMESACCINSTVRHGADLGLDMIVVGDACASFGMSDWKSGKLVGAEEVHDASIGMLAAYGKVTTTAGLMEVLGYEE